MRRTFVVSLAIGVVVALFGLIWALQGFGVLLGSPMSNTTTWSIIGPITALIGTVIAVFSWRKLSSKQRK
jgi:drug/metabolite transporter superfamily protein YnfA